MKCFSILFMLMGISVVSFAQTLYQIRADSVRIYNVCDTAELILENRTQNTVGYLFNKGKGRTEFRKISLKQVGPGRIAIIGQDTLDVSTLSGVGIDTMYRNDNNITYVKNNHVYNIPAPLKGSAWYIQAQQDAAQTADFFVAGTGSVTKLKTFNAPGESQYELYGGTRDIRDIKNRRWSISLKGTEDAALSGSDFLLNRHDNAGNPIDTPFKVTRNSGVVDMSVGGFIAASSSRIRGTGTGNTNTSYLSFVEKDGSTRSGYVGKVSSVNGDVSLLSDKGNISLGAMGAGQFTLGPTFLRLTSGVINLVNSNYNILNFDTAGVSAPALNVASKGTKLLLYNRATDTSTNFAIGIASGATWFSVPLSTLDYSWRYYGGTTLVSRLTAQGGQEWNGQGRFKGWINSDNDPASGPAVELGYVNGAATMVGFDRKINSYITLRLMGGNTRTSPFYFDIDSAGYRFTNLPGATILSTNANGYLVKNLTVSVPTIANTIPQRDAGGNINATGFLQNSRAALKKEIRDFNENALALLMKVKIRQFVYKDDQEGNIRTGIIADSTDWHFSTQHHDKFDTNSSLAITMKALQELNDQYQLLKNENETVKTENKILTAKLEALLKRVEEIEQLQRKETPVK